MGEFRVLWIAHAQSRFGGQLARVAIAVLVLAASSAVVGAGFGLVGLGGGVGSLPPRRSSRASES